jgi:hypothetical protein
MIRNLLFVTRVCAGMLLLAGGAVAQDNVFTNTAGGSDGWSTDANWSLGHAVSGAENAIIDAGISASADSSATSAYTGSLTLRDSAGLTVRHANAAGVVFGGSGQTITMNDGSSIACAIQVTLDQPIVITGGATFVGGWSTSGHNSSRTFNGAISGGQWTFNGVNGNTFNLNAANSFSNLVAYSSQNQGFKVEANATNSLGVGDVTMENHATLFVDASNAVAETATLALNGVKSGKNSQSKLHLTAAATVTAFYLNGNHKQPGDYDSSSGLLDGGGNPLISGAGTLTVLTGPPPTPPTIAGSDFVDDVYGGPLYADHPFYPITYTLTFDRDMDDSTVTSNDFENGGTATIRVGDVNETLDGVFEVEITPTSAGSLVLQIVKDAVLLEAGGGALDTSSAIPDDTTITISADDAPVTTITGTVGGNDSWNMATNWDFDVPYGMADAIVATGVTAQVGGPTRVYMGDLTVREGATVRINSGSDAKVFPPAPSTIAFRDQSGIVITDSGGWGQNVRIAGDVVLDGTIGVTFSGNGSHHESATFDGEVSGSGDLVLRGSGNNNTFNFNTTNTFSGTVSVEVDSRINANSAGALGQADLYVRNGASLVIAAGVSNAISDTALLALEGAKDRAQSGKVVLGASETVGLFQIEGLPQQSGTWGPEGSGANVETNLFSGAGILIVQWTEIPPAGCVFIVR